MLRAVVLLCAALSAGLLSGPADARSRERDGARQEQEQQDDRRKGRHDDWPDRREAAKEAGRLAQARNGGGRVLSVEPVAAGHRVKVIKDGVVRVYVVEDR